MIEKVVEHIDKLDQPHLKLIVMHDFMWALMEELASNRAHAHQIRNEDSGHDIRVVDAEVHDISQGIIDRALQPSQPTVCEYVRDKALTVNMLWEIAYGLHHESLCLDSLEDFNATEADLMSMKDDILATWKSKDVEENFVPQTHVHLFRGLQESGIYLGENFYSRRGLCHPAVPSLGPGGGGMSAVSSSFFRPLAPPPRIPSMSRLSPYIQELLPTSFPMMGPPSGV